MIEEFDGKLDETQIIFMMNHICLGLQHMHSQSPPIAHRDIKVENILLHEQEFKLCDFGSCSTTTLDYSKASRNQIADNMELFEKYTTLMYRPPEMIDQYLKYNVTCQGDVWMLGCVLFTLCFAKHPFMDAQKLAIINAHYYIPDEDYERINMKLRDLIRLLLTSDPKKRPTIDNVLKIIDNWDEIDQIPLNDQAYKIKAKHLELIEQKNKQFPRPGQQAPIPNAQAKVSKHKPFFTDDR